MAPPAQAATQPSTNGTAGLVAAAKIEPSETPEVDLSESEDDSLAQDEDGPSTLGANANGESGEQGTAPLQKRRRVTRVRNDPIFRDVSTRATDIEGIFRHVTNADGRKSSAMASNHAHIARSIAMVISVRHIHLSSLFSLT